MTGASIRIPLPTRRITKRLCISALTALTGLSQAGEAHAEPDDQVSLAIDYLEYRSRETADGIFADATATAKAAAGTVAAKLSTDIPLGQAFEGVETQVRYQREVVSGIEAIAGLRADFTSEGDDWHPYVGAAIVPADFLSSELLFFISEAGHLHGRGELVATFLILEGLTLEGKFEANWASRQSAFGSDGIGGVEAGARLLAPLGSRLSAYVGVAHSAVLNDDMEDDVTAVLIGMRTEL